MSQKEKKQKEKKEKRPISKKTALSVLVMVLIPLLFIVVLLIAFKLIWVLPFLVLAVIIAIGITNRVRPDFFAALRKPKPDNMPIHLDSAPKPSSPSTRSYMMLVSVSNGFGQSITVNASPFSIGRDPESDYCISDNYVSGRHLVIEFAAEENLCYATDYSSNGTYLNSVRMQNNVRRPLHSGDTLQIAGMLFRVEYVHF